MSESTTAIQMAELRGEVHAFNTIFQAHTIQDDQNFGRLVEQMTTIDEKVDLLLLREATREGEAAGAKKSAYVIALVVSTLVSALSWAAPYIVNG
jgi:hypothetical protein